MTSVAPMRRACGRICGLRPGHDRLLTRTRARPAMMSAGRDRRRTPAPEEEDRPMPTRHRQPAVRSLLTTLQVLAAVGLIAVALAAPWPAPAADASAAAPVTAAADACGDPFTPIPAIQGDGPEAAIVGRVTTEGVVVGDYEGPRPALRGFYLQDPIGDGDTATSDAIFVFNGDSDDVALGERVRVRGTAGEFEGQTQLSGVEEIVSCGRGVVRPVIVTLPLPDAGSLERFEGMLVRLPQTLTVTEHYQLGRFGQLTLSSGGRLLQPTQIAPPGPAALAWQAANDLNRILVDDGANDQNPDPLAFGRGGEPLSAANTLRAGDTVTGLVGVLSYGWAGNEASGNAYRVRPIGALGGGPPDFRPANPRPFVAPDVGGSLRVGVLNVLNYFDDLYRCRGGVGGRSLDCRGADSRQEFARQWPKTVAAIVGMDVDVLALLEIQNDGYGDDSALADLVGRLNAATAPGTWAYVDADAGTGVVDALGSDAIKVALLYRPARVAPVGATAALATPAFVNGGDRAPRNRPALAQAFARTDDGATFVAVAVHLKSKGSACDVPDADDGQGECAAVRRTAAGLLADWLAGDPTGTGDPDVLILGDLNAYAREDAVRVLEMAGFVDLQRRHQGEAATTYAFDGQWGTLDHALASPSLAAQATGAAAWHVNADEPNLLDYNLEFKSDRQKEDLYAPDAFRSSDHDPLVVGLDLAAP